VVAGVMSVLTVVLYAIVSVITGVGLGWALTLDTPALVRSGMSLFTDLGLLAGQVGILGGLGDHTDSALAVARGIGLTGAAIGAGWLLLAVLRGRLDAISGMAAGMGVVVLFGPVVHPWYLLWAVIPLAATKELPIYRRTILAASAVLALCVPPTGADFNFRVFQLPLAMLAGLLMLVGLLAFQRHRLAGQQGPDIDALPGHAPKPVPAAGA